jgi:hypothetical protein
VTGSGGFSVRTNATSPASGYSDGIPAILIGGGGTNDISFYEDTGTTPKFFWDASAERLGLSNLKLYSDNVRNEGGILYVGTSGNYATQFYNNDANTVHISGTGNVGIGTGSPSQKLTIGFADNSTDGISFRSSTYANLAKILVQNETSTQNGNLQFHTRSGGSVNEAMRIDSNGRVGINYTNMGLANAYGDGLVVSKSTIAGSSGISVIAATNGYSSLYLGDSGDTFVGGLEYSHGADSLGIYANNKRTINIAAGGEVTMQYQPVVSGRQLLPQTNGYLNTNTPVYFNDIHSNQGSAWNNSNGTWTCPVAGQYMVFADLLVDQAAGTTELCRATFRRNGQEKYVGYDNSRAHSSQGYYDGMISFGGIINCSANDTIQLLVTHGKIHWGSESSFGIYLLA